MIKYYENLDEAFFGINRDFLTKPHETVQFIRGSQGFIEDLLIKVKNPVATLNLNKMAFDPGRKWNHLIRSYIEPSEFWQFWEKARTVTGTSFQFRFKNKYTSNGPCLIAIVLCRNESKSPWTRAKIIWRTAELQRKFAADMVLIHNFFKEIPEECKDFVQIEEVSLYLAQAFQSWRLVGPLVPLFCGLEEVDQTHDFGKKVVDTYHRIYDVDPQPEMKFAPVIRMQRHHLKIKADEFKDWKPDDISLIQEIRKLEGRK